MPLKAGRSLTKTADGALTQVKHTPGASSRCPGSRLLPMHRPDPLLQMGLQRVVGHLHKVLGQRSYQFPGSRLVQRLLQFGQDGCRGDQDKLVEGILA